MASAFDLALIGRALNVGEWVKVPRTFGAGVTVVNDVINTTPGVGTNDKRSIMSAWCGAVYDSLRKDVVLPACGGHGDYYGNELYAQDVDPTSASFMQWRKKCTWSVPTNGVSPVKTNADGTGTSAHTYYDIVYDPGRDRILCLPGTGPQSSGGGFSSWTWEINPDIETPTATAVGKWTERDGRPAAYSTTSGLSAYDASRQLIFTQFGSGFASFNGSASPGTQWTVHTTFESFNGGYNSGCCIAPVGPGYFVFCGANQTAIRALDTKALVGGGFNAGCTGATAIQGSGQNPSLLWEPNFGKVVGWAGLLSGGTDRRDYYSLDVLTKVWTRHAGTGDIPTVPQSNGTWGRFLSIGDGLIWLCNTIFEESYILRVAPSGVTSFQLTSTANGTLPFTIGLPFKKGDVVGTPVLDIPDHQIIVKRTWNDGSVKHAIASGHTSLTANTAKTITVSSGTPPGGTALTSGNIQAAAPSASVQCGSIGTVTLSSLLASPFRTWISGPEMVECHYRSNVGADATLSVWFHVRLYKNGRVWIRAIVENGYVDIVPVNKSYVPTITIGGTAVYTNGGAALNHYAYTRYSAEGWIGGDPAITPKHNSQYLIDTKLVPNYWKKNPSTGTLDGLTQTYTPMSNGGHTASMGGAGFQNALGLLPLWDALYVTTTDPRAYRSCLANSSHLNSYPIVWRDSASRLVARPSQYPSYSVDGGTYNKSAGSLNWEFNHTPSAGYLAYLVSGDYWHYETLLMHVSLNYLARTNGTGLSRILQGETRGTAWAMRNMVQLAGVFPSGDVVGIEYQTLLSNNISYWKTRVDSCIAAGRLLGYFHEYSVDLYAVGTVAPWQQHFFIASLGMGSDLEPLSSMTNYNAVRDHIYRGAVGITGDATAWYFTFAGSYNAKTSAGGNGDPATWYANWLAAWNASVAANPSNPNLPAGPASGNTLQGSSGSAPNAAATGFWGNLLPAIAYATSHGATGADASWARLIGASNWSAVEGSGFDNTPIWGIIPYSFEAPEPPTVPDPPTNLRRV